MLSKHKILRLVTRLGVSALILFAWGCVEDERRQREEIPDYLCDSALCSNGGGCRKVGEESVCVCAAGFRGDRCEEPDSGACDPHPCENGGACLIQGGAAICACAHPFWGDRCERCGEVCADDEERFRARFLECVGAGEGACVDGQEPACAEYCTEWIGCYGELVVDAEDYTTVVGTAAAECFE